MTNFLDMRCPKCGDEDRLDIQVTLCTRACDDGVDDDESGSGGAYDYHTMSPAICRACGHPGAIREFQAAGRTS